MISSTGGLQIFAAGMLLLIVLCCLLRNRMPNNWGQLAGLIIPLSLSPLIAAGIFEAGDHVSTITACLGSIPFTVLATLLLAGVVDELGHWREDALRRRRLQAEEAVRVKEKQRREKASDALRVAERLSEQAKALEDRMKVALQEAEERRQKEAALQRALHGPADTVRPLPAQASNILYD